VSEFFFLQLLLGLCQCFHQLEALFDGLTVVADRGLEVVEVRVHVERNENDDKVRKAETFKTKEKFVYNRLSRFSAIISKTIQLIFSCRVHKVTFFDFS
jgi:hypothetical protein